MQETDFQWSIRDLAHRTGWADHWTHRSEHSTAGWPDIFLVREERGVIRVVAFECKMSGKKPTEAQRWWLLILAYLNCEVYTVYPTDDDWDLIQYVLERAR